MEVPHKSILTGSVTRRNPVPAALGAPTTQCDDHHLHVAGSSWGCGEALARSLQRSRLNLSHSVLGIATPVACLSGPLMFGGVPPGPDVVCKPLLLLLRQRTSDSSAFSASSHAFVAWVYVPQDTSWLSRTSASWPPWPPSSWLSPPGQCIRTQKIRASSSENSLNLRLMLMSRGLTAYPSYMSVIGACRYAVSECF